MQNLIDFDPDAVRAWLTDPSTDLSLYLIDNEGFYNPTGDDRPSDWLYRLMNFGPIPGWRVNGGAKVEVVETIGDGDLPEGGAVLIVELAGARFASHWLTAKDFTSEDCTHEGGRCVPRKPHIDAVIETLASAADTLNNMIVGLVLTREQIECWACQPITGDVLEQLDAAIPSSAIPDAIGVIVDSLD